MAITVVDRRGDQTVEQDILLGSKKIGFVTPHLAKGGKDLHVGLYVGSDKMSTPPGHLIQGFGNTVDEAVADAFETGRRDANDILDGIKTLFNEMVK